MEHHNDTTIRCNNDNNTMTITVMLLGDPCVGKTSFVHRLLNDIFFEDYCSTIGYDFHYGTFAINKNTDADNRVHIYDTSGDHIMSTVISSIYKKADCYIIMFSLQNPESFYHAHDWYGSIDPEHRKHANILLCGNNHSNGGARFMTHKSLTEYAKHMGMTYAEIDVRNNTNIQHAFTTFLSNYVKSNNNNDNSDNDSNSNSNHNRNRMCIVA